MPEAEALALELAEDRRLGDSATLCLPAGSVACAMASLELAEASSPGSAVQAATPAATDTPRSIFRSALMRSATARLVPRSKRAFLRVCCGESARPTGVARAIRWVRAGPGGPRSEPRARHGISAIRRELSTARAASSARRQLRASTSTQHAIHAMAPASTTIYRASSVRFQVSSGSYRSMAAASVGVCGPRSF